MTVTGYFINPFGDDAARTWKEALLTAAAIEAALVAALFVSGYFGIGDGGLWFIAAFLLQFPATLLCIFFWHPTSANGPILPITVIALEFPFLAFAVRKPWRNDERR
jgi:hypothetical protein